MLAVLTSRLPASLRDRPGDTCTEGEFDVVDLVPMTEDQFHAYLGFAVANYAQENIRAGNVAPDRALDAAGQQFQSLLPDGLDTPDQYLFSVQDTIREKSVGYLWLGIRDDGSKPFAFLYDILIFEAYRRQGYGTQALHALEKQALEKGFDEIKLRVFGHNHAARALYEKLGYVATNVNMAKRLK
jgi:ribosomal protein S18 acetylase RimI-like enzyme